MANHAALLAGLLVTAAVIFVTTQVEQATEVPMTNAQTRLAIEALGLGAWLQAGAATFATAILVQVPPVHRGVAALAVGVFAIELARGGVLPSWG